MVKYKNLNLNINTLDNKNKTLIRIWSKNMS